MNEFVDLLNSLEFKSDEVLKFVTYPKGYYALLRSGQRLDIIRAFPFQTDISDFNGYYTYLLLQTLQGFFLLRQQVKENRVYPWVVFCEFVPEEPHQFIVLINGLIPAIRKFVSTAPL